MNHKKHPRQRFRGLLSTPFVFSLIIPLVILDIFLEIYHQISFRLYDIPLVNRRDYIRMDRQKLKYLTFLEKIWCSYCGYANGLLAYAVTIAGETEKHWCGIKHIKKGHEDTFIEHPHQKNFLEYGDKEGYKQIK